MMNPMANPRRRRTVTLSDEEMPKLATDEIVLEEGSGDVEGESVVLSCASLATKDLWLDCGRGAGLEWAGTCASGLSEGQPKVNQDACVVAVDALGVAGQHVVAVFDGHGTHGEQFSRSAAARLAPELAAAAAGDRDLSALGARERKAVFERVVAALEAQLTEASFVAKYGTKSGTTVAIAAVLVDGTVVATTRAGKG